MWGQKNGWYYSLVSNNGAGLSTNSPYPNLYKRIDQTTKPLRRNER